MHENAGCVESGLDLAEDLHVVIAEKRCATVNLRPNQLAVVATVENYIFAAQRAEKVYHLANILVSGGAFRRCRHMNELIPLVLVPLGNRALPCAV
jgi:hypothetical protein